MDPLKRPTIGELWNFADNKLKEINNNSSEGSSKKGTSLIKRLFKLTKTKKNELDFISNSGSGSSSDSSQQVHKLHPLAYHTSRILDDEISKSKSLKSNTSYNSSLNDLDINALTLS